MEEKNVTNANGVNKVLLVLVVILLGGILLFGAYVLGTMNNLNNNNNNINENNTTNEQQEGTKKLTQAEVEQLLEKFGFNISIGLCGDDVYTSSNGYNEQFKMAIALSNVEESKNVSKKCSELFTSDKYEAEMDWYKGEVGVCRNENGTKVISYDVVNTIYKDLYGSNMPKQNLESSGTYDLYDYDAINNQFIELECYGCGGACGIGPLHIKEIKDYTETEEQLAVHVYRDTIEIEATDFDNGKPIIKSANFKGNPINLINSEEIINEVLDKYSDKIDVYEVVFTKDNGKYIFKSLNKKLS